MPARPHQYRAQAVHFVGFRDDRYWHAVRIWGPPDFIHEIWDRYAQDDIAPGDVVIFANGEWSREPRSTSQLKPG